LPVENSESRWAKGGTKITGLVGGQTRINGRGLSLRCGGWTKIRDPRHRRPKTLTEIGRRGVLQSRSSAPERSTRLFPLFRRRGAKLHHRRQSLHQCRRTLPRWNSGVAREWLGSTAWCWPMGVSERVSKLKKEGQNRLRFAVNIFNRRAGASSASSTRRP